MRYFAGEKLQQPSLRFDPSSITACSPWPRRGLKKYGPYDVRILGKDSIVCGLIYCNKISKIKEIFCDGLINGIGPFNGFQSLFKIPLEIHSEQRIDNENVNEIQRAIQALPINQLDLVLLLMSERNESVYSKAKEVLLGCGIPSQVVLAQKISSPKSIPWTLENIALQCYAKIGGTPWTVASSDTQKELVMGVSRAQDFQKNFVVGFITLFTNDGDYQLMYSMAPRPINWENVNEYKSALATLIVDAFNEYSREHDVPDSIVIHFCKKPGFFREVEAVEQAIQKIGSQIPYALLHINDFSNYRLFDASHPTYIPETGIKVELYDNTALLLLDGRTREKGRQKRGIPKLLEVNMDHHSTMSGDEFPRLIEQVYNFARVNWRGMNAQAIPATLNYSYLVARLVAEIGAANWNPIATQVRLRDKAWFL